jgi:hypothetical protein
LDWAEAAFRCVGGLVLCRGIAATVDDRVEVAAEAKHFPRYVAGIGRGPVWRQRLVVRRRVAFAFVVVAPLGHCDEARPGKAASGLRHGVRLRRGFQPTRPAVARLCRLRRPPRAGADGKAECLRLLLHPRRMPVQPMPRVVAPHRPRREASRRRLVLRSAPALGASAARNPDQRRGLFVSTGKWRKADLLERSPPCASVPSPHQNCATSSERWKGSQEKPGEPPNYRHEIAGALTAEITTDPDDDTIPSPTLPNNTGPRQTGFSHSTRSNFR